MVVLTIMGILTTLAVPAFLGLIANASVARAVNSFIGDTRYTRGEAMRRGQNVTICRSNNPLAAIPVCSAGDGLAIGGWMEGWVVFVDINNNNAFDAGTETVLRVQEPLTGVGNFFAVDGGGAPVADRNRITYDATGRAVGQAARWLVHANGSLIADMYYARTLCMNFSGRVRLQTGEVAC